MGLPVILTPQSQEDLGGIVRFIARHNPARAEAFGNRLIDKALTIGQMPERGRVVPEIKDPCVREIMHGPYRIIYEVLSGPPAVYVLRFWHAARGTPQL
jgi:plasmid stabilization system protein ParE